MDRIAAKIRSELTKTLAQGVSDSTRSLETSIEGFVEKVFSVHGFLHNVWEAIGHNDESATNLPIIITAALWVTVLLIVLSIIADAILAQLDPRVRGSGY